MKEFAFKINGAEYKCAVEEIEAGKTKVTVNGKVYEVETEAPKAAPVAAKPAAAPAPKPSAAPAAPKAEAKPAAAPAAGLQVKSPLPGSVIKVLVSEGQAMAEADGTVKQIAVTPGQNVMQDDLLIVLG